MKFSSLPTFGLLPLVAVAAPVAAPFGRCPGYAGGVCGGAGGEVPPVRRDMGLPWDNINTDYRDRSHHPPAQLLEREGEHIGQPGYGHPPHLLERDTGYTWDNPHPDHSYKIPPAGMPRIEQKSGPLEIPSRHRHHNGGLKVDKSAQGEQDHELTLSPLPRAKLAERAPGPQLRHEPFINHDPIVPPTRRSPVKLAERNFFGGHSPHGENSDSPELAERNFFGGHSPHEENSEES